MNELTELLETKMQSFLKDAALPKYRMETRRLAYVPAVPLWKSNLC